MNIFPSFKNNILWQKLALKASCVTINIVAFKFLFISSIVSSNILELFESSAPVGSSAKINFGLFIKASRDETHPKELQKILDEIEGKPYEALISKMMLRSMKQARYSTECTGHFGLSCKYYCHFTSPIRRYPDLQIHRIIKENLHGELSEKRIEHYRHILPTVANDNSAKERRAEEAERDVIKLKEIEYMSEHIGEEFDGVISGVTSNYIFVELDNTVEGAVSVAYMYDDFYYFNEQEYAMVGEKTKKKYQLGDKVRIKVLKCDKIKKTIDFSLIDGNIEGVEKSGEATRDETDSQ